MNECRAHKNCINRAIDEAQSICRDRGLRFTDLRRRVLEIIWSSHKPIKAYDILAQLGDSDYSAEPPTVYRTLDFLIENGIIHKLSSLHAYVGCSHPREQHECFFLICSKCMKVNECCDKALRGTIARAATKNKFNPQNTTLEIKGICTTCAMRK